MTPYSTYYPQYQEQGFAQSSDFTETLTAEFETDQTNELELEQSENFQPLASESNSTYKLL